MTSLRRYIAGFGILSATLLAACGTTKIVAPQVDTTLRPNIVLKGKIVYDGKPDYLPATVAADDNADCPLVLKYTYETVYGRDNTPQALPLFNPLSAVGFPIGGNTLVVAGHLELIQGEKVVKTYTANCAFEVTRNLFYEGNTFSEMRKEGLLTVKRNIEVQMSLDREFLASLREDR